MRPLPICQEFIQEFQNSLVLFYIGNQRDSFKIAASHNNKDAEFQKLRIKEIAEEGLTAFASEDIIKIGKLLKSSWEEKRQTSPLISSPKTDDIIERTLKYGSLGSKILGSGGDGGFILCITTNRRKLIRNIDLHNIDFTFNFEGSKIILS